jgi:LysR family transcriptional regulator, glycine cleavage system transcriptional activator
LAYDFLMRLPSTTALACFEAAARLGSFTRTAQEMNLTQAAVSRQVIGLEQRLGVLLFLRKREALVLTDAGRAFVEDVRPALQRLERAASGVAALQGRGGRLNLSVAASLCNHWLIPRLPGFTQAHPEITLNIATRVGPADFSGGQLDASLEFGSGQRPGLQAQRVLTLELAPHASPGWVRQHGKRLDEHTASTALIHHTTLMEAWPRWFAAARRVPPQGELGPRHDLMSMALNAALAGLGVALLPAFMTQPALAARQLLRLSAVNWCAERAYWLVRPQASEMPNSKTAVATFHDWLMTQVDTQPSAPPTLSESTNESRPRRGRRSPPAAPVRAR